MDRVKRVFVNRRMCGLDCLLVGDWDAAVGLTWDIL